MSTRKLEISRAIRRPNHLGAEVGIDKDHISLRGLHRCLRMDQSVGGCMRISLWTLSWHRRYKRRDCHEDPMRPTGAEHMAPKGIDYFSRWFRDQEGGFWGFGIAGKKMSSQYWAKGV